MGNLLRKQKAGWSVFNRDSLISIRGREILLLIAKTGAVLGILNYFFYREWWAFVPLIPVGVLYFQLECGNLVRKKQDQVREQFTELLRFAVTSLRAGYSVENAFLDSYTDLKKLYGECSVICRILRQFAIARQNHRPFAETWRMVGEELRVTESDSSLPTPCTTQFPQSARTMHGQSSEAHTPGIVDHPITGLPLSAGYPCQRPVTLLS